MCQNIGTLLSLCDEWPCGKGGFVSSIQKHEHNIAGQYVRMSTGGIPLISSSPNQGISSSTWKALSKVSMRSKCITHFCMTVFIIQLRGCITAHFVTTGDTLLKWGIGFCRTGWRFHFDGGKRGALRFRQTRLWGVPSLDNRQSLYCDQLYEGDAPVVSLASRVRVLEVSRHPKLQSHDEWSQCQSQNQQGRWPLGF